MSAQDDTLGISVMQYYVLHRDMSAGTYTGLLCLFTCLKDIWVDTDSKKSGRRSRGTPVFLNLDLISGMIHLSTHRVQVGESRHPSEDI